MGNANSGRRPAPTALTLLRGNPSKKRLNRAEPKPPPGEVRMPTGFSPEAQAVWDELAPICLVMGTLTLADVRPFRMLCELEVSLALARRWKTDPDPKTVRNGLKLERDLAQIVRPYYALFGLDAVSRSRIAVPQRPDTAPPKWA